jgi:hypothetical protein
MAENAKVKRPFLKRGARMPISRIPVDESCPCVEPIKNPPVVRPKITADDLVEPETAKPRRAILKPSNRSPQPAVSVFAPVKKPPVVVDPWEVLSSRPMAIASEEEEDMVQTPRESVQLTPRVSSPLFLKERAPSSLAGKASKKGEEGVDQQAPKELVVQLEGEIAKFRDENAKCRRLRLERETALGEAERMKAQLVIERERWELHKRQELQELERERGKDRGSNDRVKSLLQSLKEKEVENERLKESLGELEDELKEKSVRWRVEKERVENRNKELEQRVKELEEEVRQVVSAVSNNRPREVTGSVPSGGKRNAVSVTQGADGRIDRVFADGSRQVEFPSQLVKTVFKDGSASVVFPNGDKKETAVDGTVVYWYKATGAKQTTHVNGLEVIEFANGQVERHFPDGSKEILFANGVKKIVK